MFYDLDGKVIKQVLPEQYAILQDYAPGTTYQYNFVKQVVGIRNALDEVVVSYEYNAKGQRIVMRDGMGEEVHYTYTLLGDLKTITTPNSRAQGQITQQYGYDLNGNRIEKMGLDEQIHYHYDVMNRLVEAQYSTQHEKYTYDHVGNRLSKVTQDTIETYTYNLKNQLTLLQSEKGTTAFKYDAQGNTTAIVTPQGTDYFTYDALSQPIQVMTRQGKQQQNFYDAEGLRYAIEEEMRRTEFIFNEKGSIVAQRDINGQALVSFARGYEIIQADIKQETDSNTYESYYYHPDEQGSTTHITNSLGIIQNSYRYDAFGDYLLQQEKIPNRITYTGQQFDTLTEQYYLRARYYNPIIGRFTQEDTYRGDGLNLYAYCRNNPVIYYDPSGYARSPGADRSVTISIEAAQNPALVAAAKKRDLEFLKKNNALVDTSGDFDGLVILTGNSSRDKSAREIIEKNGLDGIYYRKGKPDFGPISLFQSDIPNMSTNRGKISDFLGSQDTNYGQFKQKIAEAIFENKGDYDELKKLGFIPHNQTKYTEELTNEFLSTIKSNHKFNHINEIAEIHKEFGSYLYRNKYTIHEVNNPFTQSPPRDINGAYNHDGGVALCGTKGK